MKQNPYPLMGLKRWSCKSKDTFPVVAQIKTIHVYDFDNTLFSSPLPNPQLWNGESIGRLQSDTTWVNGGWWHDPGILEATGEGVEIEEPRAWAGWWNEVIVQLVEASMLQKDAVTVLLTGRGETKFADLVNRMVNSRKLDFDLVVLKPEVGPAGQRFSSTMDFKQAFLRELIFTYKTADEIRVYEDRPRHVKGFRDYFERLNKSLLSHRIDEPPPPRKPIVAEVVHVCEQNSSLDIQVEASEVAQLLSRHNTAISTNGPNPSGASTKRWAIKENFIYCGYLINAADSIRLISLCNIAPNLIDSSEVRLMASNILIAPHPPSPSILDRVGGRGKKITWQVVATGVLEGRIWAAKVQAVDTSERIYTHNPMPLVVLACRRGTRPIDASRIQNWTQVPEGSRFVFETVVGDKVVLRLEEDSGGEEGANAKQHTAKYDKRYPNQNSTGGQKRKFKDRGSRSPDENHRNGPTGGRRVSDMNGGGNGNMEEWPALPGGRGGHGNQNGAGGQGRYSSNQSKAGAQQIQVQNQGAGERNVSNNRGGRGGGANGGGRYFQQQQNQSQNQNGESQNKQGQGQHRNNNNNRGGGGGQQGRGRGGPRGGGGVQGYKSLDDYGPAGNYDGATDFRAGAGGAMEMNY